VWRAVSVLLMLFGRVAGAEGVDGGAPLSTVVVGERGVDLRRVAGSAYVITEEALERRELNDLHRVVAEVPGVYFREEDGAGLRPNLGLRGANPDRSAKVTLMEDGVLFAPAPYSEPAAYYFPMVTRMTGLEVFKGPASIRFGPQTIGGAINLRTREVPQHHLAKLDVSLGNRFQARVHGVLAAGSDRWGVLGEGVFWRDDGFKRLDGGGNTGFERSEFMLKARATPRWRWLEQVELKSTLSLEDSRETYLGLAEGDFGATPLRRYAASALDRMQWSRLSVAATWTAKPVDGVSLSAVAYRHQFDRTWRRVDHFQRGPELYELLSRPVTTPLATRFLDVLRGQTDSGSLDESLVVLTNTRAFVSQGVQAEVTAKFTTGPLTHDLEAGARFHFDELRRDHVGTNFAIRDGALVADGTPPEQLTRNLALSRAVALHVSDSLTWGRVLVTPGARLELIDGVSADGLTGQAARSLQVVPLLGLGAVVALPKGLNVFAGVHQGFSPVTPGQAADIRAERALHSEVGLRAPSRRRRFEVVGFFSEYTNITGECTGSSGCSNDAINRQFNGGAARILGVEALASFSVPLPGEVELTPQATYTFTSARFLSDFTSANPLWGAVRAGDSLPYVPMHQAAGRLLFQRQALSLSVGVEVNGAVLEEAGDGTAQPVVPTRVLLDASASYQFGPVTLYVQGNNLTNQAALVARRPFGARPLAPLSVQGGVKLSWP